MIKAGPPLTSELTVSNDYKETLFLPQTDFPMRANLPNREPALLERWTQVKLWEQLRTAGKDRQKFTLHDGPPYANGPIHIGTAMNKILKDIINRSQQMLGKDAYYIPGWDCHGLPIEWQIEQNYRKKGNDKDDIPVEQFRKECRDYADKWIGEQMSDFKRLAVLGDWENPYLTMSYGAEAQIVREIGKFLCNGSLYRGVKPVMWSPVEKTALAEAEVEYHDITSPAIYVAFPVKTSPIETCKDAAIVIWTTTPWTIPGNRAIAFGEDIEYGLFRVDSASEDATVKVGQRIILAQALADNTKTLAGITEWTQLSTFRGRDLAGTVALHPLHGEDYQTEAPLFPGDFVSTDQGTGFVHIAPGHGADDFNLGRTHGLEVLETVGDDGRFYDHVPLFAGQHVFKVNPTVIETIRDQGTLVASEQYLHSYPHSWRSKKPVIFRTTPQWFISMETTGLRDTALKAIDDTRWVPQSGHNRIRSMVEARPDWCVSRQRAWGVPIPVFVNRETGEPLRDEAVVERIAKAVEEHGADIWFTEDPSVFLGADRSIDDFEQVRDILDVWFDSGSTHAFVLEGNETQAWPADLYLEGSDQHRGWFHSSLLEACGTRGRAPYEAVLTHGFVLDGQGRKMSKSLGNVVAPQKIISQNGADILRLWVATTDYTEDMRIGPEIVKGLVDAYRRLRNTLRYVLSNLAEFSDEEKLPVSEMPELERWVLHRLTELDDQIRRANDGFAFYSFYNALHTFCSAELSAFYFDIRKDVLYCDGLESPRRRAARTVLDILHTYLTTWLAPVLSFTAEEAWLTRYPSENGSVHLRQFPKPDESWVAPALGEKWARVRSIRRVVTGALEIERREKRIGSSLQAAVNIYLSEEDRKLFEGLDLAGLCITSKATLMSGTAPKDAYRTEDMEDVAVTVELAEGNRCDRCWQILPEVGTIKEWDDLCHRCANVIAHRPEVDAA